MIKLSLSELTLAVEGTLVSAQIDNGEQIINNIVTDSRALQDGEVFLALKGPNFDGHRFLKQVENLGCCAAIVDHQTNQLKIPQIIVKDTRIALGKIAAYVKQQVAPKTVAITGSSGKTTVKEMVAEILSRLGNVLATQGNFNNDIGVPLTLLRLEKQHDFAVIEMGANHLGEIAYTSNLVKPDVAIINNIAAAHLEGFGDLCGVARAKGEIFEGLSTDGVAIYNQDSKYKSKWQWRLIDKNIRRFSCQKLAEQSVDNIADISYREP
jgi:UDP-N-acetylmuramoyl-tripeptide--D-alanyl-D-alanine ligase